MKAELKLNVPLTIHWNGKLLEDITGENVVDRLPVLVLRNGVDQLLGVPKFISGTGENTSAAVHKLVLDWGLLNQVKCMCSDTTASNTGIKSGACVLLKHKMEKDMICSSYFGDCFGISCFHLVTSFIRTEHTNI